ncbi:hypothetical protein PMIT1306_00012 [Prochlorococcus sp. MIT 1306]|nr:hypothetical protein PMIT1306_00012 [Prochlorococcus sp. MIT 1306]
MAAIENIQDNELPFKRLIPVLHSLCLPLSLTGVDASKIQLDNLFKKSGGTAHCMHPYTLLMAERWRVNRTCVHVESFSRSGIYIY